MRKKYIFLILLLLIFLVFGILYTYKKFCCPKPLITFIIPTIGRHTLTRTLNSLKNMKNKNWNAIVVFDGIEPTISESDERIKIIKNNKKEGEGRNHAGKVRNFAYSFVNTEWIGFVDDDDTLNHDYIDKFIEHLNRDPSFDVLIFRLIYPTGEIFPKIGDTDFKINEVGISFFLRSSLAREFLFVPSATEDFDLLNKLRSNGKKIIISGYVGYNVIGSI